MLNTASGSMQWRCGVCNTQHSVGTGGICTRCRKFVYNRHLNTVLVDDQKRERVCSSCLTCEDKVEKGLRGIFSRIFS